MIKKRYGSSKIVPVRFHLKELGVLDKKRKKASRSAFIRAKVLDLKA